LGIWKSLGIRLTSVLLAMLMLSACGSSGGGNSSGNEAKGWALVDPSLSYSGSTAKAALTQNNVEDIVIGAYYGGNIGSAVGTFSVTGKSVVSAAKADVPLRQLTEIIKQATQRMNLPGKAAQKQQSRSASGDAKVMQRVETFQDWGADGGYVSYSLDINDTTESFFGTIEFHDYVSQGATISGSADMLGTINANGQSFSRLTLSFKSLTMTGSGFSFKLTGLLSWGYDYASSSETVTMNMVLADQPSGLTHWFRNYEIQSSYGNGYTTQTISGRYYNPGNGYVDIVSQIPLVINNGDSMPSEGQLQFLGENGSWARINFMPNSLMIEVDSDGDGVADWQVESATN